MHGCLTNASIRWEGTPFCIKILISGDVATSEKLRLILCILSIKKMTETDATKMQSLDVSNIHWVCDWALKNPRIHVEETESYNDRKTHRHAIPLTNTPLALKWNTLYNPIVFYHLNKKKLISLTWNLDKICNFLPLHFLLLIICYLL